MSSIRCACPQYKSGVCREAGCDGYLPIVEKSGYDNDSCEQLYTGFCTRNGIERFKDLKAENPPSSKKKEENPIPVVLRGDSGKVISDAINAKPAENNFLSDANLSALFECNVNTIYNWRHGKVKAPEGLNDAFLKKDKAAIKECAEKYKANRGKADAMRSKSLLRGLSEEQLYRESL